MLRQLTYVGISRGGFRHFFACVFICDGYEEKEPFLRLTGNILGIHGVFVFLIISGFLVTQSLHTSPSLLSFAWKRFLRIYPALAVCAIVSAFHHRSILL